jgi:glycosyltransferase involved in cell wall biosynthesis
MTRIEVNSMEARRQAWSVAAPFFSPGGPNEWIDDHVTDQRWAFRKVPRRETRDDWHLRSRRATGLAAWSEYWDQSGRAFPASGIITLFPQLALTAAVQKRLFRRAVPLLAWCFNLGEFPRGWKRAAARAAFKGVDRFVVHSTAEIDRVSEFLDLQPGKVEFVPLQRAPIPIVAGEETVSPFIVAMGSANRDYATFLAAAEIAKIPCKIVASPRVIDGLQIPANVSVESGLSPSQCHELVQKSRLSVVPLLDPNVASGQVTVVESMRMERAVIATKSAGTTDYVRNGTNGVLVPPHDPEALANAMVELWDDDAARRKYARDATIFAEESLSDAAAARALTRIMADLEP